MGIYIDELNFIQDRINFIVYDQGEQTAKWWYWVDEKAKLIKAIEDQVDALNDLISSGMADKEDKSLYCELIEIVGE